MLKKYKPKETEFVTTYFNSTTKTMMNHKFGLELFKKIRTKSVTGLMKDLVGLLN